MSMELHAWRRCVRNLMRNTEAQTYVKDLEDIMTLRELYYIAAITASIFTVGGTIVPLVKMIWPLP